MLKPLYFLVFSLILSLFVQCKKDENPILHGTVDDVDGNTYKTITINGQTWMAENLKVLHFSNGDPVQNVTGNPAWANLSSPAYCWYDNNESLNKEPYGALYNYYAVSDSRNLCPTGWRMPVQSDFNLLATSLGGNEVAGGKLKDTGTIYWHSPNELCSSNSSGFSARGGGGRSPSGAFEYIKQSAFFWSMGANFSILSFEVEKLFSNPADPKYGFSVRCIKAD